MKTLVQQAIESGRLHRPEDAVQEALSLWAERERQRKPVNSAKPAMNPEDRAQAFESWARSHALTPPLSDDAIRRENLVRDPK